MENTRKLFTANLKRFRNARNLTQAELAEAADLTLSGYAKLEYGDNWASPETLEHLASALHVNVWDLLADPSANQTQEDRRAKLITDIVIGLPSLDDLELQALLGQIDDFTALKKVGDKTGAR